MLWDIGAGSGSVAIEWMLAHPSLRAIAIEARADRAARIRRNAAAFGVPELEVVEGRAPEALAGSPTPDAVFIGGGASEPGVLDAAIAALKPGGRLVANAVTLETEAAADRAPSRARRHAHAHRHLARRQRRRQDRLAPGHAGDAMGLGEAMIVAGIGCRKGASAEEIGAALDTALERAGRPLARIELLATADTQARGSRASPRPRRRGGSG